ncbi:MAG: hypothetical protein EAX96_06830 [Candidatus Lokiarchaeota archaeon]|nr:hypothetical protein [Candidatus Lokiarchaeota archaeon]
MEDNNNILNLSEKQLDILKELGNIGSGNAITALSDLLKKQIEMSITSVQIIPFWEITQLIEKPDTEIFGISSNMKGKESMAVLQFFPKNSILNIIKDLSESKNKFKNEIKSLNDLDNYSLSIISEFGNILAGHYASSMANLMGITLMPNSPMIVLDSFETILNSIVAEFSKIIDYLVIIKTKIEIEILELEGILCLIPDLDTIKKFFNAINAQYDMNIFEK